MLSDAEKAWGRGRAYALLAELVARGITEANAEAARASDGIAQALSSYPNADDAAADHHFVFGLSVPPQEGAFLDARGEVGGSLTDRLRDAYAELGVAHDPRGEGAEHLATELRALGFASATEAVHLDQERSAEAAEMRARARRFLDRHLLRWLPSFAATVRSTARPFPEAVVAQIVDVVYDHRSELGAADEEDLDFALAGDPLDLDDDSVGVREIAAALSVPARVGLLVSREDVAAVGRRHRVPRGFGERRTLIHNLLRSSVSLGAFAPTIDELRALLASRSHALEDARNAQVPGLARLTAPWIARIQNTDAALARLANESLASQRPSTAP